MQEIKQLQQMNKVKANRLQELKNKEVKKKMEIKESRIDLKALKSLLKQENVKANDARLAYEHAEY